MLTPPTIAAIATSKSQRMPRMGYFHYSAATFDGPVAPASRRTPGCGRNSHMRIKIFVTGGTFDKEYNELTGALYFKSTHLPDMLKMGRCHADVDVETLMMIDSLDMGDVERQ